MPVALCNTALFRLFFIENVINYRETDNSREESCMQRIIDFLNEAGCYFLATAAKDGVSIRPFGSNLLFEGRLYMCTGDFKEVYKQLQENPRIAIAALGEEGKWLRITGEVVFDTRPEPVEAMYALSPSLRELYDENERKLQVCYIENGRAQFYTADGEEEEFEF